LAGALGGITGGLAAFPAAFVAINTPHRQYWGRTLVFRFLEN
jgi:hypothetical protein